MKLSLVFRKNACSGKSAGAGIRLLAVLLLMVFILAEPLQVFAAAKPSVTKQPSGAEAEEGQKVSFRITAKGTNLKYQWYIKVPDGTWKKMTLTSAKRAKLWVTAKAAYDGAQFRCRVTSGKSHVTSKAVTLHVVKTDKTKITLNSKWKYAKESAIHSGAAVLYRAEKNRKDIVIGVNAGHGTKGGSSVKTWCHPDHTPKVTGGTTEKGAEKACAVSSGMDFNDGTPEAKITLKVARYLKDMLLAEGYDVLMLRDGDDVQLDNVARTVICNNRADCHIAIHYDGDGLKYDKGVFFMSVPGALKRMSPVSSHWKEHDALGRALVKGFKNAGYKLFDGGEMEMDLTQTSYSTVPSVDIELGNQCTKHNDAACRSAAKALLAGINQYYGNK